MYSCTFIGHSFCPSSVFDKTKIIIKELIEQRNVKNFYVGTHGNFDGLVYKILCEFENIYDINVTVVLSRLPPKKENAYFDFSKSVLPEAVAKTPPRYTIVARNKWMIEQSDIVVFFVDHTASNSVEFARHAIKKCKETINIGKVDFSEI